MVAKKFAHLKMVVELHVRSLTSPNGAHYTTSYRVINEYTKTANHTATKLMASFQVSV